ncbi:hypothetical protein RFI_20213 [Reticulomyxa filosa]|uniref:Uncharacterized protein n=1 Tax=Reticulomyxa filosa TaxID=46433 RepID=X6MT05_RETFI|nr:hypothetical protein RFI_20213 [Reticulomyxa filosa]|eukprot:ETO17118.1 hypothetical protein RFI_20213 [Reticulomyxa filosa]
MDGRTPYQCLQRARRAVTKDGREHHDRTEWKQTDDLVLLLSDKVYESIRDIVVQMDTKLDHQCRDELRRLKARLKSIDSIPWTPLDFVTLLTETKKHGWGNWLYVSFSLKHTRDIASIGGLMHSLFGDISNFQSYRYAEILNALQQLYQMSEALWNLRKQQASTNDNQIQCDKEAADVLAQKQLIETLCYNFKFDSCQFKSFEAERESMVNVMSATYRRNRKRKMRDEEGNTNSKQDDSVPSPPSKRSRKQPSQNTLRDGTATSKSSRRKKKSNKLRTPVKKRSSSRKKQRTQNKNDVDASRHDPHFQHSPTIFSCH